jgi:serine/threonine-protein kinase
MAKVANPEIAPLLQVEPLCPPALSDIVMKALAVDPAARFQSAEEFRARLQSVLLDVDPEAGPETASRFMREAFATEYQSERKLLAALREQARQLPAELPEEDEGLGTEDTDPSRSLSSRSVTHDALPVVAPLSFEPTRRQNVGRDEAESDGETRPAAVAPPAPARVAVKVRDQAPTEAATPVFVDEQNTPAPSIVVDEGLAQSPVAERRPEPPPGRPSKASLPRVASPEPRRAAPKGASARGLNEVKEKTGERAAVKRPRPAPPPEPKPAQTLQDEEPVAPPTRQDTKAAREPRPAGAKKGSMGVWLVLPVVALLAVGGYIAWDIYSEQLAPRPKPDEATPLPAPKERKSREVKVEPQEPAVKPDDDVAPLPKEPKKLPVVPVKRPVAPAAGSPAERAFARLKADQARIVDAHAAGRFVLRMQKLEDRLSASPNDPGLQKEIEALDAEVTALLDKP